jgi:hypothetical protein
MTPVVEQESASSKPDLNLADGALDRSPSERPAASRARELLVIIAALAALAGIGALMVACTAG